MAYITEFLGVKPADNDTGQTGKGTNTPIKTNESYINNLVAPNNIVPSWKLELPTASDLMKTEFGRPDKNHSFTQEACGETILFFVFKSEYLDTTSILTLYATNPLISHMTRMIDTLLRYNFT